MTDTRTPSEFRDETWAAVAGRLHGMRSYLYTELTCRGPLTTRQVAYETGVELLTVRPRICELVKMGLAELAPEHLQTQGTEGVYQAVPLDVARQRHVERQAEFARSGQMQLRIGA